MNDELKSTLAEIIDQHERFKNSYFWRPPSSAAARLAYEKKHTRDDVMFEHNGKQHLVTQTVDCSCKNVYYRFAVFVDGIKRDIRALKRLVK